MNPPPALSAAVLTPPGAGAIAVLRVWGSGADQIIDGSFRPARGCGLGMTAVGRLRYGVLSCAGEMLDDVVACVVSREGETCTVDLCLHGGIRVIERVLSAIESYGARIEPGPLPAQSRLSSDEPRDDSIHLWAANNLIEREADWALQTARTYRAVVFLAAQRRLLAQHLTALVECAAANPDRAFEETRNLARDYAAARRLIRGATIVLAGPPNSGKSTLFNRLAGRDVAVISPVAGTTRDWVTADIELDGVPVTLVDTAGIHESRDELEQLAIQSGTQKGQGADLVIYVADASAKSGSSGVDSLVRDWHGVAGEPNGPQAQLVVVINKTDLTEDHLVALAASAGIAPLVGGPCFVSAKTGSGMEVLLRVLGGALAMDGLRNGSPCLFSPRQWRIASQLLATPITSGGAIVEAVRDLIGPDD